MGTTTGERTYQLKALTDLWTGDAGGNPGRLITTGLLGSIRWWFEVVVRGLGGHACDPTGTKCEDRKHCVVCELFGCTGWARKFRFTVLDAAGNVREGKKEDKKGSTQGKDDNKVISPQILKGETFSLRFTPLRPICEEEWALLNFTLRLIAEYGAIGGKTVFKPSDESHRANAPHHRDYGLVKLDHPVKISCNEEALKAYVTRSTWLKRSHDGFAWASLKYFWFVEGKTLSRDGTGSSTFNKALGRDESKEYSTCNQVHNPPEKCKKTNKHPKRKSEYIIIDAASKSKWLAGSQQESKKVFSFKDPARTFGFVNPDLIDFDTMGKRLPEGWVVLEGHEIMKRLFPKKGEPR